MAILLTNTFYLILCFLLCFFTFTNSVSTVSISKISNQTLICALTQSSINQESNLNCTSPSNGIQIPLNSRNISFSEIVGGNNFLCGLSSQSSSSIIVCWRFDSNGTIISYRRIYLGPVLNEIDSGSSRICGRVNGTNRLQCWPWREFDSRTEDSVSGISVGENFVCGLSELSQVNCFGTFRTVVDFIPSGNYSSVAAGSRSACAISGNGSLTCWGERQGELPDDQFKSVALGEGRGCALRLNDTVICWGENQFVLPEDLREIPFVGLQSNGDSFCGIALANYSLLCWGNENLNSNSNSVVLENVVPGPCRRECPCGLLPWYGRFCGDGLMICEACVVKPRTETRFPPPPLVAPPPPASRWSRRMIAFFVVGCFGSLSLVAVLCFLFFRYCKIRGSRIHDSGPIDESGALPPRLPRPAPVLEKRLSHLLSIGNTSHLEEFSLEMLQEATENFSDQHRIGGGSFGSVYRATLDNNREVAVKRAEVASTAGLTKRQEDMDNAFLNELEFLSRLNHKHLVKLLGFCEDQNELVLVYEFMNNGSLHDHLHKLPSSPLNTWDARIKVALDAARGIEYLHMYAVPQIIHRDIKSSNILLDATWAAKVSDFGLSLMGPKDDESHLSLHAAGTVGYMDPEYYRLQYLTTKSDVYSFGVVLLELLSGYKAIHRNEDGIPRNVVDYIVPYIEQDEVHRVLDPKVPPPTPYEIEAVAYLGYLAVDCVNREGKDRPTMTEIVNSLERALIACKTTLVLSRSASESSM